MKTTIRRATALAAVTLIAAAGSLIAPSMANAAIALSPVDDVYGGAFLTGNTSVGFEIDWEAPAAHADGATLIGYEGLIKLASGGAPIAQSTTNATGDGTFIYYDLAINTLYRGSVRAIYNVDNGVDPDTTEYSAWLDTDPSKALKAAPRVTSLSARASGVGKLTISWKLPTNIPADTDGIGGLGVQAEPTFSADDIFNPSAQYDSSSKQLDSDATSTTLNNLRPGVTYDVTVFSFGDGEGFSYGYPAATTATVIGTPAKATKLKVKTVSKSKSKLSWTGAKSTKAGPVTGYKIYVNGKLKKVVGKSTRSFTNTGEKKGKKYKYTVKTYNKAGSSAAASISKKHPKS